MGIVIAGAHGKIAQPLGRRRAARGDEVVGLVRNPAHVEELAALGVRAVVRDLESAGRDDVAGDLAGADAVVFAAGAGPGSGTDRKDTVDRAAAVLLADAAEAAGVHRYVLVSSMGVDAVRGGAAPAGVDEVFTAYLRAKLAAEEDVLARPALDVSVLRPGALTDEEPTGRIQLSRSVPRGSVPRQDVADVLVALLARDGAGEVLELVAGPVPVAQAVAGD